MFQFFVLYLLVSRIGVAICAHVPRATILHHHDQLNAQYDFIIVGGASVLVLEYGPFDHHEDAVLVPGLLNLTSTPYWFNLTSTPQAHLQNRSFQVTIAAVVGGGTVINGMLFHRGAKADYDAWEELGAKGWNWDSLLPYFKTSETFTAPDAAFAREWDIEFKQHVHGNSGPIQASYPPYQFPVIKNFFQAFHDLGITTPKDPSDGSAHGVFWAPSTMDPVTRTRSYARIVHYDRVEQRPNYHILPMSAVTKVLFNDKKMAQGVRYLSRESGETYEVAAKKEVIMAAGAVHTPQILMLSGIGDGKELQKLGIGCISDLPGVGHNFQDHPTMFFINQFQKDLTPNADDLKDNATFQTEQLSLYRTQRQGAYTLVTDGGNTVAFIPLPNITSSTSSLLASAAAQNPKTIYPDAPASVLKGYSSQRALLIHHLSRGTISAQETAFNKGFLPLTLLHPFSRGKISINATTPLAPPLVDYRTLSDDTDLDIFLEILRFNRRLMLQEPLASLSPIEIAPGANITSDEQLRDALRGLVGPTFQHPCCTCAMVGREMGGVVEPVGLRVYGVRRLSVVDASLWPTIPGAHLMGSVYGVAERAADVIKRRHGLGR
ncbi:alcohol oxidase [Polyplosphaeria fusca]|uniref:Alcohol oxidase n=1 Tax=Polyplosphaeria fusca TaxID=682080 RepID=A0A9P4QLH0_9PLEO|nr:alcohol oxidase [Polyplosphaeria fusca]